MTTEPLMPSDDVLHDMSARYETASFNDKTLPAPKCMKEALQSPVFQEWFQERLQNSFKAGCEWGRNMP